MNDDIRRYYEGLQNVAPGRLSQTQDEQMPMGWEGLWKQQRELSEQSRRDARRARGWMWFWFSFSVAKFVGDWVWG